MSDRKTDSLMDMVEHLCASHVLGPVYFNAQHALVKAEIKKGMDLLRKVTLELRDLAWDWDEDADPTINEVRDYLGE